MTVCKATKCSSLEYQRVLFNPSYNYSRTLLSISVISHISLDFEFIFRISYSYPSLSPRDLNVSKRSISKAWNNHEKLFCVLHNRSTQDLINRARFQDCYWSYFSFKQWLTVLYTVSWEDAEQFIDYIGRVQIFTVRLLQDFNFMSLYFLTDMRSH